MKGYHRCAVVTRRIMVTLGFFLLSWHNSFVVGTSSSGTAFLARSSATHRGGPAGILTNKRRRRGRSSISSFGVVGSSIHDHDHDDSEHDHLAFLFSDDHQQHDDATAHAVVVHQRTSAAPDDMHSRRRRNTGTWHRSGRGSSSSRTSVDVVASRRGSPEFCYDDNNNNNFEENNDDGRIRTVHLCSSAASKVAKTLLRGAALRIASDLTGGTPLENIKTRTALSTTDESPAQAARNIIRANGLVGLWKGSSGRTVEGALIGAVFMLTSTITKSQLRRVCGASPTVAALVGGLIGGIAQATIMTPAGLVFTALNSQRDNDDDDNDDHHPAGIRMTTIKGGGGNNNNNNNMESSFDIVRRVVREQGVAGLYAGVRPMALRQATNWASRAGLTEITRSVLGWSQYGLIGEFLSGVVGGVGSCWNTPIETIRVHTQRDVNQGQVARPMADYWRDIVHTDGYAGLFRGCAPRAVQAIWQTTFLIVVPNIMGI
jgi:Mitochondrial carrier protein